MGQAMRLAAVGMLSIALLLVQSYRSLSEALSAAGSPRR